MTDILAVLAEMQRGQVLCNINEKFNKLLKAVTETSGKGELILKVMVAPSKFAMGGGVLQMELDHEVKIKEPELAIGRSTFFVAEGDGGVALTREHPDQIVMAYDTEREKKETGKNG